MIVIFKNDEGTYSVRPAFIGFIKNDMARRTLSVVFYPFVLLMTIAVNLIQWAIVSLFLLIRVLWVSVRALRKPIWKTEIWQRPRTKADDGKRMN